MSLQQAAVITKGHLVGENVSFNAISTDTRKIQQGDLFVALQGENFDANDFVDRPIRTVQWRRLLVLR